MPRSTGTQTRTFTYDGSDLISATNPENGTVTYQYDGSHHVTKRTDAIGQETRYTYDTYGRLTEVQHWATSWNPFTNSYQFQEQTKQRVDYYYDSNPLDGSYSQYAQGRLTAVTFSDAYQGQPFSYLYSYNQAGRVTAQRMNYSPASQVFDAAYTWDNEGKMTGINYGPSYQMQYDVNGRLSGMLDALNGNATVATASYGVAGEMLGLSYFGYNETRTYNSLLQMTRMTVSGMMDMQYVYAAGQNNGRITQAIDGIAGETVNYTYDALNRLATANATNGSWGQAFTYDGFGNLTGKSVTQGSAPTLSVAYDGATNHQTGQSYDANGNLLTTRWDMFDVENRMIAQGPGPASTYGYDHAGKRVLKSSVLGTTEVYFYGITGQKLVTATCTGGGCTRAYNVYFGGKLVKSKGVVVVTDRLGSVRANSNGETMSYFPYGEERTSTADNREKFGTYTRDSTTQDYADQRYYAVGMGRFNSADPSGLQAINPQVPGSWNRYGFASGDPVNKFDPSGLLEADPNSGSCVVDPLDDEGCEESQVDSGDGEVYNTGTTFSVTGTGYADNDDDSGDASQTDKAPAPIPPPSDPQGNPLPPKHNLPPAKDGTPNDWVPGEGSKDRPTKWKPGSR